MPPSLQGTTAEEAAQRPAYLTIAEIADELRVSEFTATQIIREGYLPALRVGHRGQYRVPREAYEAWKRNQLSTS